MATFCASVNPGVAKVVDRAKGLRVFHPFEWVIGAQHDVSRSHYGSKVAQAFRREDDGVDVHLFQIFGRLLFDLRSFAARRRVEAAVIHPVGIGRQIAAAMSAADLQSRKTLQHALKNHVPDKNRGFERITDYGVEASDLIPSPAWRFPWLARSPADA